MTHLELWSVIHLPLILFTQVHSTSLRKIYFITFYKPPQLNKSTVSHIFLHYTSRSFLIFKSFCHILYKPKRGTLTLGVLPITS